MVVIFGPPRHRGQTKKPLAPQRASADRGFFDGIFDDGETDEERRIKANKAKYEEKWKRNAQILEEIYEKEKNNKKWTSNKQVDDILFYLNHLVGNRIREANEEEDFIPDPAKFKKYAILIKRFILKDNLAFLEHYLGGRKPRSPKRSPNRSSRKGSSPKRSSPKRSSPKRSRKRSSPKRSPKRK